MRVVLKVGSSTIVDPDTGFIALSNLARIVEVICELQRSGIRVILVTSGAVALGQRVLKLPARPKETALKQACAAVGQGRLMRVYDDLFMQFNQPVAQVLLTREDVAELSHYRSICRTINELLSLGVVPIINENDTTSTAEIRFGDNDTLSGLVAGMVDAQWLFLLTDCLLHTANPRTDPNATPIYEVENMEQLLQAVDVTGSGTSVGTGGMATKLSAAQLATATGCSTAICLGKHPDHIFRIIRGERLATVFRGRRPTSMRDRKWWIRHGLTQRGCVLVDSGAERSLLHSASLFAAGIVGVRGPFGAMSAVSIVSAATNAVLGCGLVNYSSKEIEHIKGVKSERIYELLGYCDAEEVIHRQNLVLVHHRPASPGSSPSPSPSPSPPRTSSPPPLSGTREAGGVACIAVVPFSPNSQQVQVVAASVGVGVGVGGDVEAGGSCAASD
eukprot:gnl/Spiro4/24712_TR12274_c0_g1_i1.p1 gnl/Spiro4/24712_TR12274_c0_g1~~gnl/Spiro4/24712_TR12274_c0_g1_i1.p1  ORF type:complete len:446 (+),score=166.29 gnl/Spiro4/24712_TR12274_c0_g1_i1:257-1594(+)